MRHGRKMSKTYGNVIDPLTVMDELGTDALRFTLLVGSAPGNDTNLSVTKVEANRNFANKIWNAGRFVISAIGRLDSAGQRRSRIHPGRLVDLGQTAAACPRRGAPLPDLSIRRSGKTDLRLLLVRVRGLVRGDRQATDEGRGRCRADCGDAGPRAGYLPAIAAPVHSVHHRGTVGPSAAGRCWIHRSRRSRATGPRP